MSETTKPSLPSVTPFFNFVSVRNKTHLFRNKRTIAARQDSKIDRQNRKYLSRNFIIRQTESRKGRMSGILRAATLVLGETAWRSRREGRKSEEKDFPGDESSRGEGRTDILGWTEKRISEGRVARKNPPQKEGDEKGERERRSTVRR